MIWKIFEATILFSKFLVYQNVLAYSLGICEMVLADVNLQQFVAYMFGSYPGKELNVVALLMYMSIINCKYVNIPIKVSVLPVIHIYHCTMMLMIGKNRK